MSLAVKDGNGAGANVKSTLDTGAHVTHHNVDTLPSAFTTDTGAIKTAVQALAALISGSRLPITTDSVATGKLDTIITALGSYLSTLAGSVTASRVAIDVSTTIATYLSNLPTLATYLNTLQGAITSARMQVDLATTPTANLATLAGAITSSRMAVNVDSTTTGKIDQLHTDLATTLALLLNPGASVCNQTSSTNSSAAFASQACTLGVFIKNISTNGQKSYIFPGGTASASNGYELAIGEERWFPCANMSTLRHFSTASGANLCWEAI